MATCDDVIRETGRAVQAARRRKGITQQVAAERAMIAQADVSRLENGKSNPSVRTLWRLAEALGCRMELRFEEVADNDEQRILETSADGPDVPSAVADRTPGGGRNGVRAGTLRDMGGRRRGR